MEEEGEVSGVEVEWSWSGGGVEVVWRWRPWSPHRAPVGLRVGVDREHADADRHHPRDDGVEPVDDEHERRAQQEAGEADGPVVPPPLRPPVGVLEDVEHEAVEVHARVAHQEAHRQQRRHRVERADEHARAADDVRHQQRELRLAGGEARHRRQHAEEAVGGDRR